MTKEEIEILEKVRIWIDADAQNSDDSTVRREGDKLVDALDDIIRKYQNH
jgi:hypothetical protein